MLSALGAAHLREGVWVHIFGQEGAEILPVLRSTDAWGGSLSPSSAPLACRLPEMVLRPQIIVRAYLGELFG
jgi:hypothetical protein